MKLSPLSIPERFPPPKENPHILARQSLPCSSPPLATRSPLSVSANLPILDISHHWTHPVGVPMSAAFTKAVMFSGSVNVGGESNFCPLRGHCSHVWVDTLRVHCLLWGAGSFYFSCPFFSEPSQSSRISGLGIQNARSAVLHTPPPIPRTILSRDSAPHSPRLVPVWPVGLGHKRFLSRFPFLVCHPRPLKGCGLGL